MLMRRLMRLSTSLMLPLTLTSLSPTLSVCLGCVSLMTSTEPLEYLDHLSLGVFQLCSKLFNKLFLIALHRFSYLLVINWFESIFRTWLLCLEIYEILIELYDLTLGDSSALRDDHLGVSN